MKGHTIGLVPEFLMQPGEQSGIDVYSRAYLRGLSRAETDYQFIVFIAKDRISHLPDFGAAFTLVPIHPMFTRSNILNILWYFFILPVLAFKHDIDVLHTFSGNRRISLFPFKKHVVTVHDVYHFSHKELYSTFRYLYFKYVVVNILKLQRHIIAISHATAEDLHTLLGIKKEKIHVVENGCDLKRLRNTNPAAGTDRLKEHYGIEGTFMLYVSTLDHPRKNHCRLVRAYARLKERRPDLPELIFVGKAFFEDHVILAEIRKLSLGKHIRLLGFVPDEDLAALYSQAEIFIHPSLMEGFGMPLTEAMACGVPVACSDIKVFREVGGDAPQFFDPYDEDDLVDTIGELLENHALQETCRVRGHERAKSFSWEEHTQSVLSLYRRLLEGNASQRTYNT